MNNLLQKRALEAGMSAFSTLDQIQQAYILFLYFKQFPQILRELYDDMGILEDPKQDALGDIENIEMPIYKKGFDTLFGTTPVTRRGWEASEEFFEGYKEFNEFTGGGIKKKALLLENRAFDALWKKVEGGDVQAIKYFHSAILGMGERSEVDIRTDVRDSKEIAGEIIGIMKKNKIREEEFTGEDISKDDGPS